MAVKFYQSENQVPLEMHKVLRFFFGRLEEIGYWQEDLVKKFREDFGDSL